MLGLRDYLRELAIGRGVRPVRLRSSFSNWAWPGRGQRAAIGIQLAALSFMVVLAISSGLLVLISAGPPQLGLRGAPRAAWTTSPGATTAAAARARRAGGRVLRRPRDLALRPRRAPMAGGGPPRCARWSVLGARAPRRAELAPARTRQRVSGRSQTDHWPRTTRVLPWMIAAFMAVLWLVPFNTIELAHLAADRPEVRPPGPAVHRRGLAAGASPPARPRAADPPDLDPRRLGAFVAVACLSLVLDARDLEPDARARRRDQEADAAGSYGSLFLIVASVVRRTEVPAFLTLHAGARRALRGRAPSSSTASTTTCSTTCPDTLLPGDLPRSGPPSPGRSTRSAAALVRGPAEIPLEAVAMLAMALPIALVGLLQTERLARADPLRPRRLPAARRGDLDLPQERVRGPDLRRADAGLLPPPRAAAARAARRSSLIVAIHVLSPGAFGSIVFQLNGNRLGVEHRERPHVGLRRDPPGPVDAPGRSGAASAPTSTRATGSSTWSCSSGSSRSASSAWRRTSCMIVTIVIVARRADPPHDIRSTRPSAWPAAAAAVAFLVVSTLFDVMSFPHCPYIVLWMAALLAVVVKSPRSRVEVRVCEELIGVLHVLQRPAAGPARRARGCRRQARRDRRAAAGPGAVSQHVTALGETRVLVDTPKSMVIDARPRTRAACTSRCSRTSWRAKPASRRSRARRAYPRTS